MRMALRIATMREKDGQRRPQNGNMDLMVEPKHKGQLVDRERDGKMSYMVSST